MRNQTNHSNINRYFIPQENDMKQAKQRTELWCEINTRERAQVRSLLKNQAFEEPFFIYNDEQVCLIESINSEYPTVHGLSFNQTLILTTLRMQTRIERVEINEWRHDVTWQWQWHKMSARWVLSWVCCQDEIRLNKIRWWKKRQFN